MRQIFIDTSGWLAILISSDFHHKRAVEMYGEIFSDGKDILIHEGILLEVGNALAGIRSRQIAVEWVENIKRSKRTNLIALEPSLLDEAWKLYAHRPDKNWGIVDCISFVVMTQTNVNTALTTDRHFQQAGFTKLL